MHVHIVYSSIFTVRLHYIYFSFKLLNLVQT